MSIMQENEAKENPLKIEGQGSWIGEAYFLLKIAINILQTKSKHLTNNGWL